MLEVSPVILRAENVTASGPAGAEAPIEGLSVEVRLGSLIQLCGARGSGRRTLFELLGWLRLPEAGAVYLGETSSHSLTPTERGARRNQSFGFIFGAPYLIPSFTLLENVAMPLFKVSGVDPKEAKERTESLLDFAGIENVADALSHDLSLETQFRCAFARSLVNMPEVLFLEAPSSNGYEKVRETLWELTHQALQTFGVTVIWTDEDPYPGYFEGRLLEMNEGRIARDTSKVESKADAP